MNKLISKYQNGNKFPKVTLVDSDKVRMNNSGVFFDDNGNIIGNSVVLPELTVRPTTPQTNDKAYYQKWLMRQADRGGRNMSSSDREAHDKMMQRIANQNEVKNFTGFDGTIYNHGSGALEQVSPEFDVLTLGRQFYTDGLFNGIGNVTKNALKKTHIGNYYVKPQYNNYSYIRQVGDDAVEDLEVTCTVDFCRLLEGLGDTFHEVTHNEHVEGTYCTGDNVYPESIKKVKLLDKDISGDKTTVNIHCDNPEKVNAFLEEESLTAYYECKKSIKEQRYKCSDYCSSYRYDSTLAK